MSLKFSENNYYGYIIKGDLLGALDYIEQFPEQRGLLERYMSIFKHKQWIDYTVDDELNCILQIYQQYFCDVFFLNMKKEEAENKLREKLAELFGMKGITELSDIEQNQVTELFRSKGFYFMGGKTSGYYGPYIWKSSETKNYEVELPKGIKEYKVILLDEFVMKGWIDYLSFGKISPGGWTDGDGIINCIKSSYDFNDESFIVSLLKHEAQHAMDLSNCKDMSSEDLEYRAKLVELIYSKERNLLKQFALEADNSNNANGHSLASNRITEEFNKKLGNHAELIKLPMPQIQSIARELFEESELLLNSKE